MKNNKSTLFFLLTLSLVATSIQRNCHGQQIVRTKADLTIVDSPVATNALKPASGATAIPSANEALEMLKAGNKRFVSGRVKHPHESRRYRRGLVTGQHPFATVLGCSDSRVIPELIFDEGIGDLFVIRVAGNIVDEDVEASIEYAVDHLETHLIVVLGHENCGAVTAALKKHDAGPRELGKLIQRIHDNVCEHHQGEPDVTEGTDVSTAVCKNVMCSTRQLQSCSDLCDCMKKHQVRVIGAIYDLKTGKVRWLD